MRKLTAFMALLALCWAASLPARAENRLALVIGEDAYEQIAPLRKAVADARGYAAALREKGYSVSEGYDVKTFDLEAKVAAFIEAIQPGDAAVFVYSGHGWSDGAQNYIVGIDAPATASALRDKASGAVRAILFAAGDKGVAHTPDGLFVTGADPRAVIQIVRGTELLPMDDFIALDRRDSLFGSAPGAGASQ